MKKLFYFCSFILISNIQPSRAQSTSNWVRVNSNSEETFNYAITKNASYVSIKLVNERLYHKSNWWTSLISKNKKAFITVDVKADYPDNKSLEDRRSSDMVDIQQKEKPIDMGWSQYIVREIPSTFSSIKLNISLNSTSEDGADKVINIASDLSQKIPALSVVQTYMGIVSGAKLLLDEVFNKNLALTYLKSNNELIAADQNNIKPGYYVIFGEKTGSAYQNYISDPSKLSWDGIQLKYNNLPIEDINYFVILVESKKNLFPVKDINILSNTETTWAKFYVQANQKIESMVKDDIVQSGKKINELLTSAKLVLDNDPSFVYSEKDEMHQAIRLILVNKFNLKKASLDKDDFFKSTKIN